MQMNKVRIRFDRRTGEEISRTVIDTFEMPDEEYADRVVRAITGRSPDAAARHIRDELAKEDRDMAKPGA